MAYCTNTEVKTEIGGISGSGDDTFITSLIVRAQQWIDTYADRTFEASANSDRTFDAFDDVEGLTLNLDEDLATINTITNGDASTVTTTEYVTEPRNDTPYYAIKLLRSASVVWLPEDDGDNENAITISGKWAFSTSPPEDVKGACIKLSAFYYRSRDAGPDQDRTIIADGIVIAPGRIPREVVEALRPYRRIV